MIGKLTLEDNARVGVMGVINLTRNSFYSDSVAATPSEIKEVAMRMSKAGADIIDIGARSTAPYRTSEVSVEVEIRLASQAVKLLKRWVNLPVSVDTTRYEVAKVALGEGATILNDVCGFTQRGSQKLAEIVAKADASLLTTAHENRKRSHTNPISTVAACLERSIEFATRNGIDRRKICVDPGIGFFLDQKISNVDWNTSVIANLAELRELGRPICVGVSRKRFIGILTGREDPKERLNGSLSAAAIAVYNGAHLIRTHDVSATRECISVAQSLREKRFNP